MGALIFFALLNAVALYSFATRKRLGERCIAVLFCIGLPPIISFIARDLSIAQRSEANSIPGWLYFAAGYCVLGVLSILTIVNGARKERTGLVLLGLMTLIVVLFLLWLVYELLHTSWKPGG